MIYDIIKLPNRKMFGSLSTTVPMFTGSPSLDDVMLYGREVDLRQLSDQLLKYKTVEQVGANAIERVFYTTQEIDLKRKWWTTKIPIFPVAHKIYHYPFTSFADVYRYLNGSMDVLDLCSWSGGHQETIYDRILALVPNEEREEVMNPSNELYASSLVNGNDEANLNMYNAWLSYEDLDYMHPNADIRNIRYDEKQDPTGKLFLDSVTTQRLKHITSSEFGFSLCKSMVVDAATPFELTPSVIYSEDNELYRWTLHRLIWAIEHSSMTDMNILLTFEDQHRVKASAEFFSKYIGYTTREIPGYESMKTAIIEELRKWICTTLQTTPSKVRLMKSWLEEVFIEAVVGRQKFQWYFDLAAYSLANLSFTDRFY